MALHTKYGCDGKRYDIINYFNRFAIPTDDTSACTILGQMLNDNTILHIVRTYFGMSVQHVKGGTFMLNVPSINKVEMVNMNFVYSS